jgi:tetratricopeptide (TPR) repeat protein
MTIYLRAWRVDTTDVDIYFGLAELYQEKGDNGTAADLCSRAIDQAPDDPKAYARAGRAYLLIRNYEQAIELLSEAVQLQPESADAHNALGEGYRASGDTVQAQRSFEEAITLDSLFTLPLRNLGEIFLQKGKEPEALKLYVRAARLGDGKAAAYLRSRGLRGE